MTQSRSEQSRLKAALVESQARAAGLEAELQEAKEKNAGLQGQVGGGLLVAVRVMAIRRTAYTIGGSLHRGCAAKNWGKTGRPG